VLCARGGKRAHVPARRLGRPEAASLYQLTVAIHGHGDVTGGEAADTNVDIRRGQRVTLSVNQQLPTRGRWASVWPGLYHGRISFFPNTEQSGTPADGGLTVGRFSFTLPVPKTK
jgi:hypothetical protein